MSAVMGSWWRSLWPDERVAAVGWMAAIAWLSVIVWPLLLMVGLGLATVAAARWIRRRATP